MDYNIPMKGKHIIPYFINSSYINYTLYMILMELGVSVKIASIVAIIL